MTDYGLEVYNNRGILLIDSKYKNYVYHQHGTTFVQANTLTEGDITPFSSNGILLTKPTDFLTKQYGFIYDSTSQQYTKILLASDATGYIDWIIYKDIDEVPEGEYGLNVFDSTGNIVFSSNELGYFNVASSGSYSQQEKTVIDADNNYFSMVGMSTGYTAHYYANRNGREEIEITRNMTGMIKVDSTTLDFDSFVYNIEIIDLGPGSGSGGFLSSGGSSAVPNDIIEIKKPPSI